MLEDYICDIFSGFNSYNVIVSLSTEVKKSEPWKDESEATDFVKRKNVTCSTNMIL